MKSSYSILLSFLFLFVSTGYSQTAREYLNQGNAKRQLKDFRGAIADFTKVIEINPKDKWIYYTRGEAKIGIKDYNGAIEDFNKALELDSENSLAFSDRYHALKIIECSKKIQTDPTNTNAYCYRGDSKNSLLDYTGAIADYTRVIEIDPYFAWAYNNRGLAKISLGQKVSGCMDLKKAKELGLSEAQESIKEYCQ